MIPAPPREATSRAIEVGFIPAFDCLVLFPIRVSQKPGLRSCSKLQKEANPQLLWPGQLRYSRLHPGDTKLHKLAIRFFPKKAPTAIATSRSILLFDASAPTAPFGRSASRTPTTWHRAGGAASLPMRSKSATPVLVQAIWPVASPPAVRDAAHLRPPMVQHFPDYFEHLKLKFSIMESLLSDS
jgi:hypothetical protein